MPVSATGQASRSANEFVAKALAVRLDPPHGWMGKMNGQHKRAAPGGLAEKLPARLRRLVRIPAEDSRPIRLAALQRVMHQVADDNRMLSARMDVDATMHGE